MPLACTAMGTLQILDWRRYVTLIVCSVSAVLNAVLLPFSMH